MKNHHDDPERALLESLGFTGDLIDSPSGTRLIHVIFGDEPMDDELIEHHAAADGSFACVA